MKKLLVALLVLAFTLAMVGGAALAEDNLIMPTSLTIIDEEAFYGDTALDRVVLENLHL